MRATILLTGLVTTLLATGQPASAAPQQTQSRTASDTTAAGASSVVFTNSAGQTFSVDDLASQLKNLRSAVEQTLPILSAFTQSYSNSSAGNKSLTGKLTDFVSGALDRNGQQTSGSSGQTSSTVSNAVGVLRGLLNKNNSNATASTASPSVDANTVHQLGSLQNELQPIIPTLQQLNVESSNTGNSSSRPLTPTGR
jgi:hypothetical protein